MDPFPALLACPACGGDLADDWACVSCGGQYEVQDGIPALLKPPDARTRAVRDFYDQAPFPGYPSNLSLDWLRARASRSPFPAMLDQAIAADARIVEIGCGTGAMSLYLCRANRLVVGADISRNALRIASGAARRCGIGNVQFVETDIASLGLRHEAFDLVYSSGVLHHTQDPEAAFHRVARLARPGGIIVIGLYNAFARIPLRVRRGASRLLGQRWICADPVLRDRKSEPGRHDAWLRDQYRHPEEHRHTLAEVQRWFAKSGIDYLRAYPSALLDRREGGLLDPEGDAWRVEGWMAQIGWMRQLGRDGGLFVTVGRRRI